MATKLDAIGNFVGSLPNSTAEEPPSKVLLIGSHLDTVVNAGRYDGSLGVLLGLAVVEMIREIGLSPPFAIDVIGFCEEEGIRYRSPFIGSRWLTGCLEEQLYQRVDEAGVSMRSALHSFCGDSVGCATPYAAGQVIGFIEPHIEQGPVLDREDLTIGVVDSITSQTRATIRITGYAGHAGTVPMPLRRDALTGAAEWIAQVESLAAECPSAVATVGNVVVSPNIANVISSEVRLSLDVRHSDDEIRENLMRKLIQTGRDIASRRGLQFSVDTREDYSAISMNGRLSDLLAECCTECGIEVRRLPSGAGHDAGIMAQKFPAGMLFVRCRDGISHHPDESVRVEDVAIALEVLVRAIYKLGVEAGHP